MPAITIPGTAGIVESKKARLAAAVQWHWNIATAKPETKVPTATEDTRLASIEFRSRRLTAAVR